MYSRPENKSSKKYNRSSHNRRQESYTFVVQQAYLGKIEAQIFKLKIGSLRLKKQTTISKHDKRFLHHQLLVVIKQQFNLPFDSQKQSQQNS